MKKPAAFAVVVLASSFIGGCTAGPNYHRPQCKPRRPYVSERKCTGPGTDSFLCRPSVVAGFRGSPIAGLIRTALKQNYDLELATERINAARAELAVTRSNLFPQLSGDANFNGGKSKPSKPSSTFCLSRRTPHFNWISSADFAALQKRRGPNSWRRRGPTCCHANGGQRCGERLFRAPATGSRITNHAGHGEDAGGFRQADLAPTEPRRRNKADVLQAQQVLDTANAQIPTLRDRLASRKMRSTSCLAITPRAYRAAARSASKRCLPMCSRRAFLAARATT